METILWMICFLPLTWVFTEMVARNRRNESLLLAISAIASTALLIVAHPSEMNYYRYADSLGLIEIVDSNELTIEELQSRNGRIIVERIIGVVDNSMDGSGHVLNNPSYYINYSCVQGVKKGDVVCTYFVYNPDTNYEDDIISRFDYIIETGSI